ncbi:hypothetical protein Tco_1138079 [Tanacetum coccineum]
MLSDIEDSHGPSDARHNPSQPLKVRKTLFQNSRRFTHFYQLSHSELVDIEKVALSSSIQSLKSKCTIEFNTTAGNPVKEILLKLNLSAHRTYKEGHGGTDNAKITRKRSKPDKHRHENGKSAKEPEDGYQWSIKSTLGQLQKDKILKIPKMP